MRTYGRITNQDGSKIWLTVTTTVDGQEDYVWITTLCQTLLLNLNESPFFADYGIPAYQSIVTQVFPDFYIVRTQQRFAQYFASLLVSRQPVPTPVYLVNVTTNQGFKLNAAVPIAY